jgi:Tfp pilus assembly protein PilN
VVERELALLERPLAAVLLARRELRDAEATVQAVAAIDRLRGGSLAALDAVTLALPDSAVLTSLAWSEGGSGLLTGVARRAADVVAQLERTNAVPAPRLEGPAIREPSAGREWERFTIAFGGKPRDGER